MSPKKEDMDDNSYQDKIIRTSRKERRSVGIMLLLIIAILFAIALFAEYMG